MVTISRYYSRMVREGSSPSLPSNVVTDIEPVLNPPSGGDGVNYIQGPRNLDGGAPDSVYLSNQNVDGGPP